MAENTPDSSIADIAAQYEMKAHALLNKLILWYPASVNQLENPESFAEWVFYINPIKLAKHIAAIECMLIEALFSYLGEVSIKAIALVPYIHATNMPDENIRISPNRISQRMSMYSGLSTGDSYIAWLLITAFMLEDLNLFTKIDYTVTLTNHNQEAHLSLKPDNN